MSTSKRASELKVGERIIRFDIACTVVRVELCTHPIGGECVRVTHTDGKQEAIVNFKPQHRVITR